MTTAATCAATWLAVEAASAELEAGAAELEAGAAELEAGPAELVSAQTPAITSSIVPAGVVKIRLSFVCPLNAERSNDVGIASLVKPVPPSRVRATFVNLSTPTIAPVTGNEPTLTR